MQVTVKKVLFFERRTMSVEHKARTREHFLRYVCFTCVYVRNRYLKMIGL